MALPARRRSGGDEGSPAPRGGARGILLLAVAVLGCSSEGSLTASLAEQLAGRRPFAGRLTLQPRATVPVGAPGAAPDAVVLARLARDRAGGGELADGHLRGVLRLLIASDGKGLDEAVQQLVDAVEARPDDASLRTDLVVAYLARAEQADRPEDRVAALAESRRAVELAPTAPATLYDRALALDGLGLVRLATSAWKAFLAVEPTSVWADEARARLVILEGPTRRDRWKLVAEELAQRRGVADAALRESISGYMQEAREHAMEELLPAWGAAVLAGEVDVAAVLLEQSGTIGGVLVDQTVADTVASIDGATDEATRRRLAEGMVAYGEGRRLFAASDTERAREPLERSRERLESAGCPMWRWAEIWLAGSDLYRSAFRDLEARLTDLRTGAPDGWLALQGRCGWALGLASFRRGEASQTMSAYNSAEEVFSRAREAEDHGAMLALFGEMQGQIGENGSAWALRLSALKVLADSPSSVRRHNLLWDSGTAASRGANPSAAGDFLDEDVLLASSGQTPVVRVDAHLRRAMHQVRQGDLEKARADLDLASRAADEVPSEPLRRRAAAQISRWTAESQLSSPELALAAVDRAVAYHQSAGIAHDLAETLITRSRARVRLGDVEGAEKDLLASIQLVEAEGASVTDIGSRLRQREVVQGIYEAMVLFQVEQRNDSRAALRFSRRARWVLEEVDLTTPPRLGREESIGDTVSTRLEYYFANDELLIWRSESDELTLLRQPVGRRAVAAEISAFVNTIKERRSDAEIARRGAPLYAQLVRPFADQLTPGQRLVIVPDGPLAELPFSALRADESAPYLIEQHPLVVSPGMAPSGDAHPLVASAGVLLVAAPRSAADSAAMELRDAQREVEALAELYPEATVLVGAAATPPAVLEALPHVRMAHFASHALEDAWRPELSSILLAGDEEAETTSLRAVDFRGLDLRAVALVVLAGCGTAKSVGLRAELSLTRTMLAQGVGAVIGYLWGVDDLAASQLSSRLHEHLRRGEPPAAAARNAQLELISAVETGCRHPASWANLRVLSNRG